MSSLRKFVVLTALLVPLAMAEVDDYTASVDKFSGQFYKEAVDQPENKGKNVVISPFSADLAMSIIAYGAEGETKKEITDSLSIKNFDETTPSIRSTLDKLLDIKGVEMKIANKLYNRPSSSGKYDSINPTYGAGLESTFKSETEQVNFKDSKKAADTINHWVEDHTNNRIKNLISEDSLSEDTAAVVVNAIYFLGSWKEKFNPASTSKTDFKRLDGSTIPVDMMYREDSFHLKYSAELNSQIVLLPYENDAAFFVLILPFDPKGITELEKKLVNGTSPYLKNLYKQECFVGLPKMKIESTVDVKGVFENLGVKKAFTPGKAELGNILVGDHNLYISKAVQKTFIEVNENGAEAAAATGLELVADSLPPQAVAAHPFIFEIIVDDLVLFQGRFTGEQ